MGDSKRKILEFIIIVLKESKEPLMSSDIWRGIVQRKYHIGLDFGGVKPWILLEQYIKEDITVNENSCLSLTVDNNKEFFKYIEKNLINHEQVNTDEEFNRVEQVKLVENNSTENIEEKTIENKEVQLNMTETKNKVEVEVEVEVKDVEPIEEVTTTVVQAEEVKIEKQTKKRIMERDLHPFHVKFIFDHLNTYCKTIYHEKSNKKNYNRWLHPDIVGVNFAIDSWENEVLDLGGILGSPLTKIYSFELKKELNFSVLREYYFQAVSNSSWANEGYLVVAKLDTNNESLMKELERLNAAFGIGIILLNIENPLKSKILLQAKYRNTLDWETINKLSKENPDFRSFIVRIHNDIRSKEIRKEEFDKILEIKELIDLIS